MARGVKKQENRNKVKSIHKSVRLTPEQWERVEKLIAANECTFSDLIIDLINTEISQIAFGKNIETKTIITEEVNNFNNKP
jgi:macrodomain Ter protein organizer (MatP/YcbG family)